ncbi:hypothetical protein DH2020_025569 [Rehmannia glutinosa]|uniref:Exostosin GT47 domain-containing protein n=1 Tax=Rehmannia glutinosa TaxID=99300 RepID=A0ABR0VZD5_REHGL
MMKNGGGGGGGGVASPIVVLSVVFAASIAIVFVLGYFSDRANGFGSFYSGSEAELKIPRVELVTAAARVTRKWKEDLRFMYIKKEPPIVHDGPCKDIYTSEGRFIHEMEHGNNKFRTSNAQAAHVYFMPFSVTWMVKYLYKPNTYDLTPLKVFASDYVKLISTKHPFWNRTHGADHFMLSCHDWGDAFLYNTSIRVLCNANSSEGFNPQKDVSLPEIHLYGGIVNPKLISPPPSNTSRPYLAFFAGGIHGSIRPILLKHWKGTDSDLHIYEYLPKDQDYYDSMLRSKFCLCPSGYEVASPRIVEAIYAECIPVILSDHYVLPFSDVLRWDVFSIQVDISEIPR